MAKIAQDIAQGENPQLTILHRQIEIVANNKKKQRAPAQSTNSLTHTHTQTGAIFLPVCLLCVAAASLTHNEHLDGGGGSVL